MLKNLNRLAAAVAALAGAMALPVLAQEVPAQLSRPADAMTVVRDADTGQLRAPTAAEHEALRSAAGNQRRRALSATAAPVGAAASVMRYHATGAKGTRMPEELMSQAVMVRGVDGKLAALCVASKDDMEAAMKPAFAARMTAANQLETE